MTRLLALTVAALGVALPLTAAAQPTAAASPEPLPLARLLDDALVGNPALRAAKAGADIAGANASAAQSTSFPRISFSESWQRGDQPVFVFSTLLASRRFAASNFAIEQLNHPDPLGYFHATVGIEQLVFDGGARGARIDSARAEQETANLAAREASLVVAETVVEVYGRLLSAQTGREAALAAVRAGREDLARAERRRDAGVVTEADVLALRVHVADMEQRAIQAQGDATVLRAQLNRLGGAPIERTFVAVEPLAETEEALPPVSQLIAEASTARTEVRRAALAERIADNARRTAKSPLIPQVAAQATFDVSGTKFDDRASAWLIGGEVRWSISTGGTERALMKAAAASATRARAEAEDVRAQLQVEVVSALEQMRSARAQQAVGRAAVAQARESERIIRDRYEAGLLPINDVLRAAGTVLDAETQRVAAVVNEMTGRARLNRAVGRVR